MRFWLRMLTVLTSTLLSVGFGEMALRTFRPSKKPAYMLDERYLYKPVPSGAKTFRRLPVNGGGKIFVKFNSLGFRGEEFANVPSRKRILIYGDSFIEGDGSQLDDTFAKGLEKELGAQVINAGVLGYGPDQISLRMDDELGTLKPDLVIVSIYSGNDFGDLLRNKIYRLDSSGHASAARHIFGRLVYEQFRSPSRFEFYEKTKNLLERIRSARQPIESSDSDSGPAPSEYLAFSLQQAKLQYEDYPSNEVSYLLDDYYDTDIALLPQSESARLKVSLMEQTVIRLKKIADVHHTPLLFLIIPAAIDSCPDYEVKIDPAVYPEYLPSRLTGVLESMAAKEAIPFVDLFEPFKASKERLFFHYPDDHWNDAGQKLATHTVAEFIRSNRSVR